MPASDEERVQGAVRLVQLRRVSKVVDDYKHLVQFLHFQLLGRLRDLALLLDDAPQRRLVPLVPVGLLASGHEEGRASAGSGALLKGKDSAILRPFRTEPSSGRRRGGFVKSIAESIKV